MTRPATSPALLAICAALPLASCGETEPRRTPAPQAFLDAARPSDHASAPFEPAPGPAFAFPDAPVFIPVRIAPGHSGAPALRTPEGVDVLAEFHHLTADPIDPAAAAWITPPARLAVDPSNQSRVAILVAQPPAGTPSLTLDAAAIPLRWLETPDLASSPIVADPAPPAAELAAYLDAERRSPRSRWRARLIETGLTPAPIDDAPDTFSDPTLEAWARDIERRWWTALSRLRAADPLLAAEVVGALTSSATFPPGVRAPTWEHQTARLEELQRALLGPELPEAGVIRRWLDARPSALAWVVLDAGPPDAATGLAFPRLAFTNLGPAPALAWGELRGRASAADLAPVAPASSIEVELRDPESLAISDPAAPLRLRVGSWAADGFVRVGPIPTPASGLTLRPFAFDWSLDALASGVPISDDRTAALLTPAPGGSGWRLFFEAARAPDDSPDRDRLEVRAGAGVEPRFSVTISASGAVDPPSLATVRVASDGDRWTCVVDLPPDAADADGVLRLSLTRTDARGRRSHIPRPTLPWAAPSAHLAVVADGGHR